MSTTVRDAGNSCATGEHLALVYLDEADCHRHQPWQDINTAGPLIDEAGNDMELIGWTTERT